MKVVNLESVNPKECPFPCNFRSTRIEKRGRDKRCLFRRVTQIEREAKAKRDGFSDTDMPFMMLGILQVTINFNVSGNCFGRLT